MVPYMVGKLASNSSYLTRGLIKYVSGRGYFRAVPSQNGKKNVTTSPPPIVKRVVSVFWFWFFCFLFLFFLLSPSCDIGEPGVGSAPLSFSFLGS